MFSWKNYRPPYFRDSKSFIEEKGGILSRIHGEKIRDVLAVWESNDGEWDDCYPIILKFENAQLEFAASSLDEFSLTVNEIDTTQPIACFEWLDQSLSWKSHDLKNELEGKTVEEVGVVEFKLVTESLCNPGDIRQSPWMLVGVYMMIGGKEYQIYNGLDCTNIGLMEQTGDQSRKIRIHPPAGD